MKLANSYIIPFTGLKEGYHEFSFTFDSKFFDEYTVLEAHDGFIKAAVLLDKKSNMLKVSTVIVSRINLKTSSAESTLKHLLFYIYMNNNIIMLQIPEVLLWAKIQSEEQSPNLTTFTEHFNKMSYW